MVGGFYGNYLCCELRIRKNISSVVFFVVFVANEASSWTLLHFGFWKSPLVEKITRNLFSLLFYQSLISLPLVLKESSISSFFSLDENCEICKGVTSCKRPLTLLILTLRATWCCSVVSLLRWVLGSPTSRGREQTLGTRTHWSSSLSLLCSLLCWIA